MPVLADDDVVVHGNAERGRNVDDRLRHLDIGLRRRRRPWRLRGRNKRISQPFLNYSTDAWST